ncbi:hypothetical protein PYW08_009548 [Mythimna loreyi]|uniref:Uncharacterized protein n=1 Tax=Mythimna loreyi TaxID=667449 RepID=A0ACC2Q714_9NEOP|nr:hypothetical protein PYW08_009548 [Mythimna loreyi]
MKSCFKYFVLLFCLNFIEGAFRCDYKYNVAAKGWFKYHVVPATWFDARLRCSLEGAELASPTTLEIQSEMMNIIKETNSKQKEIFTGIHATLSQGDYNTIEGTPLAKLPVTWATDEPDNLDNKESCITFDSQTLKEAGYNKFSPGEPNGEDTEFCGCIFRSGLLCNVWCNKEFTFICEKSPNYPGVCHESSY